VLRVAARNRLSPGINRRRSEVFRKAEVVAVSAKAAGTTVLFKIGTRRRAYTVDAGTDD
jgi:hypothetical protein